MQRMFYYAKLNENNVCYGFESLTKKIEDISTLVYLTDYNESYLYKKWLGDQWSQETYEPSIDTILQDKVDGFEITVTEQNNVINNLINSNTNLSSQIVNLEGTIMELTMMLASIQGGI